MFDRLARSQGVVSSEVSPLDRLAYVGKTGMGALVYEPIAILESYNDTIDLDRVAYKAQQAFDEHSAEGIEELFALNGPASGARPKAALGVSEDRTQVTHTLRKGYEPWLGKFPNTLDGLDSGATEYVYSLVATEAGIEMPDVHLFPSFEGPSYFAARRIDRDKGKRLHMHSARGLPHADFRLPSFDYEALVSLTCINQRYSGS